MRDRRADRNDDGESTSSSASSSSGSHAGKSQRYKMREDLITFGDDFWIETKDGDKAFKVDGKAVRVRNTLVFEDPNGQECCQVQTKIARLADSMTVEDPHGKRLAIVKKAFITPVRERFTVKFKDGPEHEVQGNIVDHEYKIGDVAEVSRRWFRVRDTYGVEVEPGQDDAAMLAVTVAIDQMEKAEEEGKARP